jgi:transposase
MGESISPDLVLQLLERIATLEARVAELEAQLAAAKKNSRNSSKPPSSDITNPKPPRHGKKRKSGGQPGHTPHFRIPFAPEELDEAHRHEPPSMFCSCGGHLIAHPASDRIQQQIELVAKPLRRIEHRAVAYYCGRCGAFHRRSLPSGVVRAGFIGPDLASCLAFLKAKAHASYSSLRAFTADVLGCPVSRGELAKTMHKVSKALAEPYARALGEVPKQQVLNIDETGHKENGKRFWTWTFRAPGFAVFKIDASRSSRALASVLGDDYSGIVGCDYFSAYRKHSRETGMKTQFCHAHLIRDVLFLAEHPEHTVKEYGKKLRRILRRVFRLLRLPAEQQTADHQDKLRQTCHRLRRSAEHPPPAKAAENMAKRFREHGEAYFRFLDYPGVEPTNNAAEQTIRFVVLDRAVTQGTRGSKGRDWSERIWTAVATCAIRKTSLFKFLRDAMHAYCKKQTSSSLTNGL